MPAQRPVGGQSLAPCEPNRPFSIVAPVQASGRKVTAIVPVLDRERQRGAQLIAVQRAVAGGRHPARAVAVPVAGRGGRAGGAVVAGLVALVAEPARPEIFAARRAEEAPEAEALVGERDRPVGIAFAGGDRVAHSRDQQIADLDLGRDAVDAVVRPGDADGGHRCREQGREDRGVTQQLRFGVTTAQLLPWPVLVQRWQYLERLGFDTVWLIDHLVPLVHLSPATPSWRVGHFSPASPRKRSGFGSVCSPRMCYSAILYS